MALCLFITHSGRCEVYSLYFPSTSNKVILQFRLLFDIPWPQAITFVMFKKPIFLVKQSF